MIIQTGILFLATVLAMTAAQAQKPAAVTQNSVPYATGGIGDDEVQQLQAREKEFNLKLVFTLVEGNYLSDVAVVVKDKAGKAVLVLNSLGPLVLARLLPGSYVIEATHEGKKQTRKVEVRDRLRTEYLRWSSNPEHDFPGPK